MPLCVGLISSLILIFIVFISTWSWRSRVAAGCHSWMFLLRPQQAVTCSGVMLFGSTVELNFHGLLVVCDSLLLRSLVLTTVCSLTHSLVHPLASSAILPVASLTHSLNCSVTCHSLGTTHSLTLSLADDTRDEAFCLFPRFKIQIEWKMLCEILKVNYFYFCIIHDCDHIPVRFVHIFKEAISKISGSGDCRRVFGPRCFSEIQCRLSDVSWQLCLVNISFLCFIVSCYLSFLCLFSRSPFDPTASRDQDELSCPVWTTVSLWPTTAGWSYR